MPRSCHFIRPVFIAALLIATSMGAFSDETPAPSPPANSSATPVPPEKPTSIDLPKDDSDAAKLLHFDSPQRIHGRFLVEFKSDAELAELRQFAMQDLPTNTDNANRVAAQVAKQVGGRVVDMIGRNGGGFVFVIEMPDEQALELAKDPRIKLIEPDMVIKEAAIQTQVLPSDNSIWHLDRIDQINLPVDHLYHYDDSPDSGQVYIIDSGIRATHHEFANDYIFTYMDDCTVSGGNNINGEPLCGGDINATDCRGHGTEVAGAIGAVHYGSNKSLFLKAVKVTDCATGTITSASIVRAFWSVIHDYEGDNYPSVIDISIVSGADTEIDKAAQAALDHNIVIVSSAGNGGNNACNYSPGRLGSVINVGGTDQGDHVGDSNYGPCVTLFAPMNSITTALNTSDTDTTIVSGTSFAAPQVAGIAAHYYATHGTQTPSQVLAAMFVGATSNVIQGSTGCLSPPSGQCSPNALLNSLLAGLNGALMPKAAVFISITTLLYSD